MKAFLRVPPLVLFVCASTALTLLCPTDSSAADSPQPVSKDGLQLKVHTSQRLVYVKPGATFNQFDQVMILDCYVEFQKGWQQNYNSSVDNPSRRVTDQDVQRMKSDPAAEFKKVFTAELQKGGYQIADKPGPSVLLMRPAIINLQVTSPDIQSAGIGANLSRQLARALYISSYGIPPQTQFWRG